MRTVRLFIATVTGAVVLSGCGRVQDASVPFCPGPGRNAGAVVLMAQAVPSAAYVPCVSDFPAGWSFGGQRIRNGHSEFWMDSDRAGVHAVTVVLAGDCDISRAVESPQESGEPPMRRFEEPIALPPTVSGNRYYVFPGGCITYRFSFAEGATFAQVVEASHALTFVARADGVAELAKVGVILCGRGVRCPG